MSLGKPQDLFIQKIDFSLMKNEFLKFEDAER